MSSADSNCCIAKVSRRLKNEVICAQSLSTMHT